MSPGNQRSAEGFLEPNTNSVADARVVTPSAHAQVWPPLEKEGSREGTKLEDSKARQLEVDEDEQLEVVEEREEDWGTHDELIDVERQASSEDFVTFSGGTLVSEERVRLQLRGQSRGVGLFRNASHVVLGSGDCSSPLRREKSRTRLKLG
ncbi:unnamed protein product [Heligmosomoides polygyrus]|uniref:PDZ domain-containing protein n=1 Tax=Heligmosomoides polygyrus TaxID=6339 RepID=A0A183FPY1_HELPZ|nr:unnamed protein product [Heligmosomoides polygyrus]